MDAAEFRGLRQAHALDHRLGMIELALLLLRRYAMGVLVNASNVRRCSRSGTQQPVRAAPADDLSARAMGPTLALHALNAGRPKGVLCPLAPGLR